MALPVALHFSFTVEEVLLRVNNMLFTIYSIFDYIRLTTKVHSHNRHLNTAKTVLNATAKEYTPVT